MLLLYLTSQTKELSDDCLQEHSFNKKEAALNSLNTASLSCTVSCLFTLTGWLKAAIIYTCSVGK